jgi:hypothetical protein
MVYVVKEVVQCLVRQLACRWGAEKGWSDELTAYRHVCLGRKVNELDFEVK